MNGDYVKLDLEHYKELFLLQREFNAMKTEVENLRKKNKDEAYDFLFRFIVKLKYNNGSPETFSLLEKSATEAGYSIIFESSIGQSQLGQGEKIIKIISDK